MNQRGFGLVVYIIAAAVLVAAFLGYGQYRYSQGVDKERTRNINAVLEKEVEMSTLRRKHSEELFALARRHTANNEAADRKIRDLLSANKALSDWWNFGIPPDLVDYIWVQPTSDNSVRRRPYLAQIYPSTGETGEAGKR